MYLDETQLRTATVSAFVAAEGLHGGTNADKDGAAGDIYVPGPVLADAVKSGLFTGEDYGVSVLLDLHEAGLKQKPGPPGWDTWQTQAGMADVQYEEIGILMAADYLPKSKAVLASFYTERWHPEFSEFGFYPHMTLEYEEQGGKLVATKILKVHAVVLVKDPPSGVCRVQDVKQQGTTTTVSEGTVDVEVTESVGGCLIGM